MEGVQAHRCRSMNVHEYTHQPTDTDRIIIDKSGKADKLYVQRKKQCLHSGPKKGLPGHSIV
jgi:hypothetical protein